MYGYEPGVGDVFYLDGNRQARVLAVIPVDLAAEFVDGPLDGVLEVEPHPPRGADE